MINLFRQIIVICMLLQLLIVSPLKVLAQSESALFAGGCFWCLEHDLEELDGVISAESGYSGGDLLNPTYENHNGHQEVVKIVFNSTIISYKELLKNYWFNIDPYDDKGQFCDRGNSYQPVIFTSNSDQEREAEESKERISIKLNVAIDKLKVEIRNSKAFWIAESYHQDFAINNPIKYNFYRTSCGRDNRLKKVWSNYKE